MWVFFYAYLQKAENNVYSEGIFRFCRSMDRTLPCEGRNAGSIPARSTKRKSPVKGLFRFVLLSETSSCLAGRNRTPQR